MIVRLHCIQHPRFSTLEETVSHSQVYMRPCQGATLPGNANSLSPLLSGDTLNAMDSESSPPNPFLAHSVRVPLLVGLFSPPAITLVSLVVVSALVPHREEGIRSVVDLPWSTYAFLCLLPPLPLIYLTSYCAFRGVRQRTISFLVGSALFFPCALTALGIARRVFMGKF